VHLNYKIRFLKKGVAIYKRVVLSIDLRHWSSENPTEIEK